MKVRLAFHSLMPEVFEDHATNALFIMVLEEMNRRLFFKIQLKEVCFN
jgi:hypothetical protein